MDVQINAWIILINSKMLLDWIWPRFSNSIWDDKCDSKVRRPFSKSSFISHVSRSLGNNCNNTFARMRGLWNDLLCSSRNVLLGTFIRFCNKNNKIFSYINIIFISLFWLNSSRGKSIITGLSSCVIGIEYRHLSCCFSSKYI